MAGRGAHSGLKADRLEIGGNILSCRAALVFIGWISGNRSDPQQGEQPPYTLINILVDLIKHRVESLHERPLTNRHVKLATLTRAEKKTQCRVGLWIAAPRRQSRVGSTLRAVPSASTASVAVTTGATISAGMPPSGDSHIDCY